MELKIGVSWLMANELFIKEKTIYRVLKPGLDKLLVVKSDEKKLPFFISPDELEKSYLINQDDLLKATGISFHSYDELDEEERWIHRSMRIRNSSYSSWITIKAGQTGSIHRCWTTPMSKKRWKNSVFSDIDEWQRVTDNLAVFLF